MDKKKDTRAKVKKAITMQDLKKAEMDPILNYRLRQRTAMMAIITGKDLMTIRQFARKTISIAKQRNSELTHAQLQKNIVAVLKKVKPEMREIMLQQMREYVAN